MIPTWVLVVGGIIAAPFAILLLFRANPDEVAKQREEFNRRLYAKDAARHVRR